MLEMKTLTCESNKQSNSPVFCADCRKRDTWVRNPKNDSTIEECWICTNCEAQTFTPKDNYTVHFGELD